jgi:hypothetical protein
MVYGASFQVREETDVIVVFEMLSWFLYLNTFRYDIIYPRHTDPGYSPID